MNKIVSVLSAIGVDKYLHITCSEVIASLVIIVFEICDVKPLWCFLSSIAAIIIATFVKEYIIDKHPDPTDGVANAFGAWWVWTAYAMAIWS